MSLIGNGMSQIAETDIRLVLDSCRKAKGNLLTMAVLNIGTDIALFVFPIPLIWKMNLSFPKYVCSIHQLGRRSGESKEYANIISSHVKGNFS